MLYKRMCGPELLIDALSGVESGESLYATRFLDDPDLRMLETPRVFIVWLLFWPWKRM